MAAAQAKNAGQTTDEPIYVTDKNGNQVDVSDLTAGELLKEYGDQLDPEVRAQLQEEYDDTLQEAVQNGWVETDKNGNAVLDENGNPIWVGSGAQRGDEDSSQGAGGSLAGGVPSIVDQLTSWIAAIPGVDFNPAQLVHGQLAGSGLEALITGGAA